MFSFNILLNCNRILVVLICSNLIPNVCPLYLKLAHEPQFGSPGFRS